MIKQYLLTKRVNGSLRENSSIAARLVAVKCGEINKIVIATLIKLELF